MTPTPPWGTVPVVLVMGPANASADGKPLAVSLAARRQRILIVATGPLPDQLSANTEGAQPFSLAPFLWQVSAPRGNEWADLSHRWVPDFNVVLVQGHPGPWSMGWAGVATHGLLIAEDNIETSWGRLRELPERLPVGCMVADGGRPLFDQLAGLTERAGRRPLQWLGHRPGERSDWCRAFARLTRRSEGDWRG